MTRPPAPHLPPGWYPDPAGGGAYRWWDGIAWTAATQAPAAPPRRSISTGKAVLLTFVGLAVLGWLGNTASQIGAPKRTAEPTTAAANPFPKPAPAAPGEIRDGTFAFQPNGVVLTPTVGEGTEKKTAAGTYAVVTVLVTNAGTLPAFFSTAEQKLVDTTGRTYSPDGDADIILNKEANAGLGKFIPPGKQLLFKIAYDLPSGTQPRAIELHESNSSNGVTADLQ